MAFATTSAPIPSFDAPSSFHQTSLFEVEESQDQFSLAAHQSGELIGRLMKRNARKQKKAIDSPLREHMRRSLNALCSPQTPKVLREQLIAEACESGYWPTESQVRTIRQVYKEGRCIVRVKSPGRIRGLSDYQCRAAMNRLAEIIQDSRIDMSISQEVAANSVGWNRMSWANVERGMADISFLRLWRIAGLFASDGYNPVRDGEYSNQDCVRWMLFKVACDALVGIPLEQFVNGRNAKRSDLKIRWMQEPIRSRAPKQSDM